MPLTGGVTWPVLGVVVAGITAAAGAAWSVRASVEGIVEKRTVIIEARVNETRDAIADLRGDVKAIRVLMERERVPSIGDAARAR